MRSALSYRPGRDPLRSASAPAAIAYLAPIALAAFLFASPILIAAAAAAGAVAGIGAGARDAVAAALRLGIALAVLIVAVNVLVSARGATVLVRGWDVPVLGSLDVTLESLAAGGVIGLRLLAVVVVFAVYCACVDPDEVLRLLRPIARRSALTASLVARMAPVAAADAARLGEAAALRGPGAAPVGRAALLRRLVAGSLDRAVDVAATLELRGYALQGAGPGDGRWRAGGRVRRRARHDRPPLIAAAVTVAVIAAALLAGVGGFDAYPTVSMQADIPTLLAAAALPLAAALPFVRRG